MLNIFSTKNTVPAKYLQGELPDTKTAMKELFTLAIPIICEMVFISLISSIDTMMVGSIGKEAIAAVGLSGQVRMLFVAIFNALGIGVTAVVARRKGEGRQEDANRSLCNTLSILFLLSLLLLGIAQLAANPLIKLSGAKAGETLEPALSYFRVVVFALPMNALTIAINSSQRGVGMPRITLYCNIGANIVNVIFNYLLINGIWIFPKMGVAGAALATVISAFVALSIAVYTLFTKGDFLKPKLKYFFQFKFEHISPVIKLGTNSLLEQYATRFCLFIFNALLAGIGTDAYATHQICIQYLSLMFNIGFGIGAALTSLVGVNIGKKRPDVSMMYGKLGVRLTFLITILTGVLGVLFRSEIVMLFNKEDVIVNLGSQLMLYAAVIQVVESIVGTFTGALRGAGDTKFTATTVLICGVSRPFICMLFLWLGFGLWGAWTSIFIDFSMRFILYFTRFNSFKWAHIQL